MILVLGEAGVHVCHSGLVLVDDPLHRPIRVQVLVNHLDLHFDSVKAGLDVLVDKLILGNGKWLER